MNKLERMKDVFNKACEEMKNIMNDPEEKKVLLSDLNPGERFDTELGKFIVLGHDNGVTKVLQDDFFAEDVKFDDKTCDYTKSALKKMFDEKIEPAYLPGRPDRTRLDAYIESLERENNRTPKNKIKKFVKDLLKEGWGFKKIGEELGIGMEGALLIGAEIQENMEEEE